MPFDPNLPANNSPIVSAELRSQFTALRALIPDGSVLEALTWTTSNPPRGSADSGSRIVN